MLFLLDPSLLCGVTAWKNIKSVSDNNLIQCNINIYLTYEQFSVPVIINTVMYYTQNFICRSTITHITSMRTFEVIPDNLTSVTSQVIHKNTIRRRQSEQPSRPSARYGITLCGAQVQIYSFLPSALSGREWSTSRPGHFTSKKEPRCSRKRRLCGPKSLSGGFGG